MTSTVTKYALIAYNYSDVLGFSITLCSRVEGENCARNLVVEKFVRSCEVMIKIYYM